MAKPKPMFPAKTKPVNLTLRSPWSARENSPQDVGFPFNPVNVDEEKGSHTSTRRLVRTTQTQKSNVFTYDDRNVPKVQILGNRTTEKNFRTLIKQRDLYGQRLQEQSFRTINT